MSYGSPQLSPHFGTHRTGIRVVVQAPPNAPPERSPCVDFGSGFYRSDLDQGDATGLINWGTVFGLTLTVIIGASFWTGVGMLLARLWK